MLTTKKQHALKYDYLNDSFKKAFDFLKKEGLEVFRPYDEVNDITFYQEPLYGSFIVLEEGDFVTVAPEDAHKPRGAAGTACEVKKVVVKINI